MFNFTQLAIVLVAAWSAAFADTIDFESQCPSGPQPSGPCSSLFSNVGNAGTLTIPTSIGSVTIQGGTLFDDISYLPADETAVYGTAGNAGALGVTTGSGFTNPLVITFPTAINGFAVDVLNGNTMSVDYQIADNSGDSANYAIAPNLSGGLTSIGFAAAGDVVTIEATTGQSTPSGITWDFLIDNISFDTSTPTSATPEPTPAFFIGTGLVALGLVRRNAKCALGLLAITPLFHSASAAPAPIALACPAATTGTVGLAYSSSLKATGGVPPYTISITAGSIPTGLTLNATTGAITGTPTAPGASAFTAKVVDSLVPGAGGAPNSTTANCNINVGAPTLSIKSVSFFSNISIYKDTAGATARLITNPMWTSSGTNERVGYAGGAKMSVSVTLHVDTPAPAAIPNVTIQAKVAGVGNLTGAKPVTIPGTASDFSVSGLVSDTAFARQTKYFANNSLTLDWTYTVPGGTPIAVGLTSHTVYVTLQSPISGTTVFLTTIHLAVSKDGAANAQDAFNNTWNNFFAGPANTTGWDGRTLYYYQPNIGFTSCSPYQVQLLKNGNGQCTSWAKLMIGSLAVNGISSRMYTIYTANGDEFLVKDWTYGNAGAPPVAGDPHKYPMTFKAMLGEMVPSPTAPKAVYGDMTSLDTLPGQNTKPPAEKVFARHFIVKYAPTGTDCTKTDCYYDPSYGVTYRDETGFQGNAVDGYLKRFPTDAANSGWVAKPAGLNIKFKAS